MSTKRRKKTCYYLFSIAKRQKEERERTAKSEHFKPKYAVVMTVDTCKINLTSIFKKIKLRKITIAKITELYSPKCDAKKGNDTTCTKC